MPREIKRIIGHLQPHQAHAVYNIRALFEIRILSKRCYQSWIHGFRNLSIVLDGYSSNLNYNCQEILPGMLMTIYPRTFSFGCRNSVERYHFVLNHGQVNPLIVLSRYFLLRTYSTWLTHFPRHSLYAFWNKFTKKLLEEFLQSSSEGYSMELVEELQKESLRKLLKKSHDDIMKQFPELEQHLIRIFRVALNSF